MSPFRTILVAADFSESTRESFRVACSLARQGEARVIVLYVAEPMYVPPKTSYFGEQTARFTIVERDPDYYEAVKERLREIYAPDHPLEVEYRTRVGPVAAEEIVREAEEAGANLIVMGTHGRTGLRRLLAGSVAEAVLRSAPCPVLALRQADRPREHSEIGVILHPTDFSEPSEASLRVARALARDHGARLVLLHVAPIEITAEGMVMPIDPAAYRGALDEIRARINGLDHKLAVETLVTEGLAAAEILRAAEELKCDLVVMGTHGRTGLGRLVMGSVAEAVMRGAACPVLSVKQPAAVGARAATTPVAVTD